MCWDIVSRYYIWKPNSSLLQSIFQIMYHGPLVTVLSNKQAKKKIISFWLNKSGKCCTPFLMVTPSAHCYREGSKKNTFEETYLTVFPWEFPKIVGALNTLFVMCIPMLCRKVFPGMTFWGLLASNFQS